MPNKFAYTNPEFKDSTITTQPECIPSPSKPPMNTYSYGDRANTYLLTPATEYCIGEFIANVFCDCFMQILAHV